MAQRWLKFIYSEKATKFCEISTVHLSYVVPVKSMVEISQMFVAFFKYMNFNSWIVKFAKLRPLWSSMYRLIVFWRFSSLYFNRFLSLATYAEEHIEDEDAPVFLRFINLLINDAIYLLDEALGYMKQIQVNNNFLYISAIFGHCTVLLRI